MCSVFLRRGGTINCIVNGHRRYSEDLPQGGLEIPCRLTFTSTKPECSKLQKLIRSSLAVTVVEPQVQVKIERPDAGKQLLTAQQPQPSLSCSEEIEKPTTPLHHRYLNHQHQ